MVPSLLINEFLNLFSFNTKLIYRVIKIIKINPKVILTKINPKLEEVSIYSYSVLPSNLSFNPYFSTSSGKAHYLTLYMPHSFQGSSTT